MRQHIWPLYCGRMSRSTDEHTFTISTSHFVEKVEIVAYRALDSVEINTLFESILRAATGIQILLSHAIITAEIKDLISNERLDQGILIRNYLRIYQQDTWATDEIATDAFPEIPISI